MKKQQLKISDLKEQAKLFCIKETEFKNSDLFGITDGKAVGTYIEHKFQEFISSNFKIEIGSSAKGVDLPSADINTDIKVTSIKQTQSSCPFKDGANEEDITAYLTDRNIPAEDITLSEISRSIIANPPKQGYLTISNALQWRLQYGRIVKLEKKISGINKIIDKITG